MVSNRVLAFLVTSLLIAVAFPANGQQGQTADGCERTITANVVALDQPYLLNRLGASMPEGMVYALERDVMSKACAGKSGPCNEPLTAGNVQLRAYKRARPIVLRANVGDCLSIYFTNLLAATPVITNPGPPPTSTQPATRNASLHVAGMEMVKSIKDDGSFVGVNPDSNVAPGQSITYVLRARAEGTFMLNSEGAVFGGPNQPNDGAQVTAGLFGAVNVQPRHAEWYRSQVTHDDVEYAINTSITGGFSALGQPFINYKAKFPAGHPRAGQPVLAMLDDDNNLVATDLTAVITGPNAGPFPSNTDDPNLQPVNIEPNRLEPYREFTIAYHELFDSVQAFPIMTDAAAGLQAMLLPATDGFAINYGTGGIGAEILANRFGVGPMGSCADCRFEEFFLSAWTVGDASMLVDNPANVPCTGVDNQWAVTDKTLASVPCTTGVAGNAPHQDDPKKKVTPYRKATKVLYPDDPSNVYHSYINDRVKFRILHTGTGVSHVHHLHAHQWVHSPNSDGSTYLDSQLINPGSAYTLEITFKGGGNRNKTVGDSIFHCHFYPHFAAGMWAMWRTHDVYEVGSPFQTTKFESQLGKYKTRALPDGEIAYGTPIPGLIPMPTLMMPPMPGTVTIEPVKDPNGSGSPVGYKAVANLDYDVNPGFPFFIPGVGGTRAPHPPLDFAVDNGVIQDGGLPRHVLLNAKIDNEQHSQFNFAKDYIEVNAYQLPEDGTEVEKVAMAFHATCYHPSFTPEGLASVAGRGFRTNGRPPVHGAPFADPALDPKNDERPDVFNCDPIAGMTRYKAAVIESDLVLNKKGWHYPQSRYLTLWQDVLPNIRSEVSQEPLFIRANSNTVVEYWHTNLVPDYFEVDDFEVRTPTDIIGQHIHLVKFDVTASDGAANGFNYEDGTFSFQEVAKLIDHVNECGGLATGPDTISKCVPGKYTKPGKDRTLLTAKRPPKGICSDEEMKKEPCKSWYGAQTTVQRWFADPIDYNTMNGTRTLRTVFTHDHFGPSTHQQAGLYAAFVVEPEGSDWYQSETGVKLHTRDDGGPTTWNAIIETPPPAQKAGAEEDYSEANTYREFMIAVQDFHLAYRSDSPAKVSTDPNVGWSDPETAISPALAAQNGKPRPQIVSGGPFSGTTTFNYRGEPLPYRLAPPAKGKTGDPKAVDLSYVFSSLIKRNDDAMNVQPTPGASINSLPPCTPTKTSNCSPFIYPKKELTFGMQGRDPYTPLLRAYEGDRIQVRVITGAHMLPHSFTMNGMKWLFEPSFDDSGYRSTQAMGISEHFEFLFRAPRASPSPTPDKSNWTDYLYMPDASNAAHGLVEGTWGIFRAYKSTAEHWPAAAKNANAPLRPLSTNPVVKPLPAPKNAWGYSCPDGPPNQMKQMSVQSQTRGWMFYNTRGAGPAGLFKAPNLATIGKSGPPTANDYGTAIVNYFPLIYTRADNRNTTEPLVLRANAGDCIAVTVENVFNPDSGTFDQTHPAAFAPDIALSPSPYVGLNPALVSYDAMASAGLNVGFNPDQLVPPASSEDYKKGVYPKKTYYWYAGQTTISQDGKVTGVPMELGSVNLTPSDPLEQDLHGLIGGLIVEPPGTIACVDTLDPTAKVMQYTSATVYAGGTCDYPGRLLYREFVLLTQDDLANVEWNGGQTTIGPAVAGSTYTSSAGSTQVAINYRTEPMPYRFGKQPPYTANTNVYQAFSDAFVLTEPQTPIFSAAKGTPTRFRLLHPGGSGNPQILALHGHVWQELPYTDVSTAIGDNRLSQWLGMRDNYATNTAYEIVLPSAGGTNRITGDYVWRNMPANILQQGMWGIFRVADGGADAVRIASAQWIPGPAIWVHGSNTVFLDSQANAKNGQRAETVALYVGRAGEQGRLLSDKVPVGDNGLWCLSNYPDLPNCAKMTPETEAWLKSAITGDPTLARFVTAVSPYGGTAVMSLQAAVWPPPTLEGAAAPTQSESTRFLVQPRDHGEKTTLPATAPAVPPARPSEQQQPPQQ
ncbi:MAG TPA: hypothetical protein VEK57_24920 [Thermoanaerobaculia bacterium]|nr:hypothetical protein [Thermoanaerobaculia bacterium]